MTDADFQGAVDIEADRLLRLTPCELMQVPTGVVSVPFNGQVIDVSLSVRDLGDERHIGILAQRNLPLGHRKFARGIRVVFESKSMTSEETGSLYD
ncbi:hypothetical protein ABT364_01130 [Massilia sp. SR12]